MVAFVIKGCTESVFDNVKSRTLLDLLVLKLFLAVIQ